MATPARYAALRSTPQPARLAIATAGLGEAGGVHLRPTRLPSHRLAKLQYLWTVRGERTIAHARHLGRRFLPIPPCPGGAEGFKAIAAGPFFSLAVKSDDLGGLDPADRGRPSGPY